MTSRIRQSSLLAQEILQKPSMDSGLPGQMPFLQWSFASPPTPPGPTKLKAAPKHTVELKMTLTSDPPASTSPVLGYQEYVTKPGLCYVRDQTGAACRQGILNPELHASPCSAKIPLEYFDDSYEVLACL